MNTVSLFQPVWRPGYRRALWSNLFNDMVSDVQETAAYTPRVDVKETADSYVIQLAAPGLKKEDFQIGIKEDVLTIQFERKAEEEKEGDTWHIRETRYGSYRRSFRLPQEVLQDGIQAAYTDGILTLTLPKNAVKVANRSISVN